MLMFAEVLDSLFREVARLMFKASQEGVTIYPASLVSLLWVMFGICMFCSQPATGRESHGRAEEAGGSDRLCHVMTTAHSSKTWVLKLVARTRRT